MTVFFATLAAVMGHDAMSDETDIGRYRMGRLLYRQGTRTLRALSFPDTFLPDLPVLVG